MVGVKPGFMYIETCIDKGIAMLTRIHREHPFLTIGDFAQGPAVLARDACRMLTLFWKTAPIYNQYRLRVAQRLGNLRLQTLHESLCRPASLSNKLLHCADEVTLWAEEFQDHRFNCLAFQVRQLTAEIEGRPFALLTALKARMKRTMIIDECLTQEFHVLRCQFDFRRLTTRGRLFAMLVFAISFFTHGEPLQVGLP